MTIPSPPEPDPSFLARVAEFDAVAFRQFYTTFVGPVRAKLFAVGLRQHEVDELADDVLYEAVRKLATYDAARGRFINLLLTIAQRRAIDFQRHRGWQQVEGRWVPREESLEGLELRAGRQRRGEKMSADETTVLRFIREESAGLAEDEEVREPSVVAQAVASLSDWLAGRPEADRIAADHYMFGASWKEVAVRLSSGEKTVTEDAAKMRGTRLLKRAMTELPQLAVLFQAAPATQQPVLSARGRAPTMDMDGVQ